MATKKPEKTTGKALAEQKSKPRAKTSPSRAKPSSGEKASSAKRQPAAEPVLVKRVDGGDAKGIVAQTNPLTLGNRLQRTRQKLGMSIRELADKAGINKDTVVKLEKGNTPSYRTLCRVCDGLGVSVVQLLKPEADAEFRDHPVSLHARRTEKRLSGKRRKDGGLVLGDVDHRQILAKDEAVRLSWLACRLPGGQMNSWLLELREETEPTTHAGEEFVFCLKGQAKLTVAGMQYELAEGDAATFWSAEPHSYGPSQSAIEQNALPVLLLSVWISSTDRKTR